MLLRDLRPALRLPQDLLCTLIFSSSNLESRLAQCPQTHRVKDWDFSIGPGLGGTRQVSQVLKPSPQITDPFSAAHDPYPRMWPPEGWMEQDTEEIGMWGQQGTTPAAQQRLTYRWPWACASRVSDAPSRDVCRACS